MKKFISQEIFKSILVLAVAFASINFWQKQQIKYQISFSKKIEIISDDRKSLMEYARNFDVNWNAIRVTKGYINDGSNIMTNETYKSDANEIYKISERTNLLLGNNSFISNDSIKPHQDLLITSYKSLFKQINTGDLDNQIHDKIDKIYDTVILIYGKEINKFIDSKSEQNHFSLFNFFDN